MESDVSAHRSGADVDALVEGGAGSHELDEAGCVHGPPAALGATGVSAVGMSHPRRLPNPGGSADDAATDAGTVERHRSCEGSGSCRHSLSSSTPRSIAV